MSRPLTTEQIERFASRKNVKRIAVENFLMTVGNNPTVSAALYNLQTDARLYKWNAATQQAIRHGISLWAKSGVTF